MFKIQLILSRNRVLGAISSFLSLKMSPRLCEQKKYISMDFSSQHGLEIVTFKQTFKMNENAPVMVAHGRY